MPFWVSAALRVFTSPSFVVFAMPIVEVAVGCCVVWKHSVAPATTIAGLRALVNATPQQFKSNADTVDFFPAEKSDEALPDDYQISKSVKLWAKKKVVEKKVAAAKASGSKKSASSKKTVFEALTIPLNFGTGHPTSFIYGDKSVTATFATQDDAKEYFEGLCEDWDIQLQDEIAAQEAKKLQEEEESLKQQLEAIKQKRSNLASAAAAADGTDAPLGVRSTAAAKDDEGDEVLVKKKVKKEEPLSKFYTTPSGRVRHYFNPRWEETAAAAAATEEDPRGDKDDKVEEEEEEETSLDESDVKPKPKASVTKQASVTKGAVDEVHKSAVEEVRAAAATRGIFVDADVPSASFEQEVEAALKSSDDEQAKKDKKSKKDKKGFKPQDRK